MTILNPAVIAFAVLAGLSLWLRLGFPTMAVGYAVVDDALFIRLATSIAHGDWLGPYDNLTLAKGPIYPLFIAASSLLAMPLKVAEQSVYLAVSAMIAAYVGRLTSRRWLGIALFALLAFNPAFWDPMLARVIREGLYVSLSFALVGLAVYAAFGSDRSYLRGAFVGAVLGVLTGAFWLTREEGLWILPALAVVMLLAFASLLNVRDWTGLRRLASVLVLTGAGFMAVYGAIAGLNDTHYGIFATNEFKTGNFERAYGAISRIKPDAWRQYVVFPADARRRAYAASPKAAELRPFLDGAGGEGWRRVACDQMRLPNEKCPEILSGWFMWALRDAVTAAGHGGTASSSRAFYGQLADEIDAACLNGSLSCLPPRATLAPPFRWKYLTDSARAAGVLTPIVLTMGGGHVGTGTSSGSPEQIAAFQDLVGDVASENAAGQQRIIGWVAAPDEVPDIFVRAGPGVVLENFALSGGTDVETAFPGYAASRFDLVSNCQTHSCDLVITPHGGLPIVIPCSTLATGSKLETPVAKMYVDRVSVSALSPVGHLRQGLQVKIATLIGHIYGRAMPYVFGLAVVGLGAAMLVRYPLPLAVYALSLASLTAIICRISLLSYLDAVAIPSANSLYALPASPFVALFTLIGIYAGVCATGRQVLAKGGLQSTVPPSTRSARCIRH